MTLRIDLRPDERAKNRLERAAARLGMPLSSFVLSAALERAQQVLTLDERVLSDRDRARIMALLESSPPAPNKALKKASKRHRELIGEEPGET